MALTDKDIITTRAQGRRRFLAKVGGALVGAAAVAASSSVAAKDAKDYIARDNKGGTTRDKDQPSGDKA
jgi:hypothetical protein